MSVLPKLWYAAVMIRLRNDAYSMIANFTRYRSVYVSERVWVYIIRASLGYGRNEEIRKSVLNSEF